VVGIRSQGVNHNHPLPIRAGLPLDAFIPEQDYNRACFPCQKERIWVLWFSILFPLDTPDRQRLGIKNRQSWWGGGFQGKSPPEFGDAEIFPSTGVRLQAGDAFLSGGRIGG